jgi:hypothetical protein
MWRAWLVIGLVALAPGCSESRDPSPAIAKQPETEATPAPPPLTNLAAQLAALEDRHSPAEVETTLETLPALLPYFEQEGITSAGQAVQRHWDGLSAAGRKTFVSRLAQVMEHASLVQELTAELPNGYHDVAFALPESKALYEPVLEQYDLDLQTATSYDIASSLSTYHETSIQVSLAAWLCEMPESERADYLRRFRLKARALQNRPAR